MKRKVGIIILVALCITIFQIIASGFSIQTSAYIADDFIVSEDGGVKPHYLKFYSAWGGFNSSIGAKNEYVLKLEPEDTEIYVYHGDGGYELTLKKDVTSGEWYRVK